MPRQKFDPAACIIVPAIVLTLSSVSLLSFRLPTHADAMPPSPAAVTAAPQTPAVSHPAPIAAAADDDGDGDELLEHWGDPKYSKEERLQLAGMGVLFVGAAALQWKRVMRFRRTRNVAKA